MEISACGRYCEECPEYKNNCFGCYHTRKEKLMEEEEDMCPIYKCVMKRYADRKCCRCPELPCRHFYATSDRKLTETEKQSDIRKRVNALRQYKK